MKLLTFTVPCYNSQDYMEKCIDSLLPGGEEVEILIVDDGSRDRTGEIADSYAERYPTIIKVIHQENGGHGEGLNTGIRNAAGLYFKVVDSDDWVDQEAYEKILNVLRRMAREPDPLDMLVSNYVYEKQGKKNKKVMSYASAFPEEKIFTWDRVRFLRKGQYILMHSVIYRTQLLRDCKLDLPKHTFYVDNLFVFQPLPYVKTLYYLNVEFYRYFIGREDQSVNEKVMIGRVDQQLRVTEIMIDVLSGQDVPNDKLQKYMANYLDINMSISSIMLLLSGTEENIEKKQELWQYLKQKDAALYKEIRYGLLGNAVNLPGKNGRKISLYAYKAVQQHMGFN